VDESTSHMIRVQRQENARLQEENKVLHAENQALVDYLRALEEVYEAAQELGSEDDLFKLLDGLLYHALHLTEASDGSVLLLDEKTHELMFAVVHGDIKGDLRGYRIPADKGIAGWVAAEMKPVIANDARQDWRFSRDVDERFGFVTRALVCVPLVARSKLVGVIEVLNKHDGESFTEADVNLLLILGYVAAAALETMRGRLDEPDAVRESTGQ
jgi:GAF domain-containing protein